MKRLGLAFVLGLVLSVALAACGDEAAPQVIEKEVVVEKEVIKEVPVEKIVTQEVVKEVQVPGETVVVEKEVIKEVQVPGETVVVTKEVVKEVPVEVVVEREVTRVVEVPVEVVVEKEVIKIVEVEKAFAKFGEAPQLTQAVQGGNLPPVDQRLPSQPMVIPTFGETGKYGGTLRRFYLGPADGCNFFRVSRASMVRFSQDGFSFIPAVAKGWEVSDDGKQWTFFLREGMKWSDGDDFNADDIMFQYEEVILNDDLTSGVPRFLQSLDQAATVEKIDDVTVRFNFPNPNFIYLEQIAQNDEACNGSTRNIPWTPSHYMKQFHIKFNPNADADAKAASLENWTQLYDDKTAYNTNPEKPSLAPWHYTTPLGGQLVRAERNKYFWAVDPAGNQLPYIDNITLVLVDNPEIGTLKAVQGEIDMQGRHIQLPDFTVLKEGEEKGGYHVLTWPTFGGADAAFFFNQSFPGPTGDAIRDVTFRQALSLAIDRDSINEVGFLGLGTPRQSVPAPGGPHFPGFEVENTRTQFDPDLANQMLDTVFPDKDSSGFRLSGGERININIGTIPAFGPFPDIAETVARNFEAVGVKSEPQIMTRSLFSTRRNNNEIAGYIWTGDSTGFTFSASAIISIANPGAYTGAAYGLWVSTDGAEGIEPPQELLDFTRNLQRGSTLPTAERNALGKEIYKQLVDRQYNIGIVGLSPMTQGVLVVNNRLQNVPEKAANDWPVRSPSTGFPEQWWFSSK